MTPTTFRIPSFRTCTLTAVVLVLLGGCEVDTTQQLEERTWTLSWSDEFDGPAGQLPNADNWTYDIGTGDNGWGNGEFQYYTNRPENVSLNGEGQLVIAARREAFAGSPFTSARIITKGRFTQAFGRIEARLKTPYGPGMWPAFWMLGANIDDVNWPQCGEIDIMELRGQQPHVIHGSLHGPGYSGGAAITGSYALENGRFDTDFHVFAVEWYEDRIDFFVDDFLYNRIAAEEAPGEWVYDQPFFLLLNVAVGGNFVGFPTSQTPFPQTMVVDYVRVYK
ncbi:MAG: glycoside hydrolase family 16 protein [Bacteroidia bacterium]